MEKVLMIVASLSLVAFAVGIFNPQTVHCSSRGKAALIFISLFLVSAIIGASLSKSVDKGVKNTGTEAAAAQEQAQETEIPTLKKGSVYTISYANKDVQITFADIKANKVPNDGINLVLTLRIKNNSNEKFFISNSGWKLLDEEKVEVEESGIYDPVFGDYTPGTFFFTVVEPNVGKEEKVGYAVKASTYYLSIDGNIIAKIPLGGQRK